MIQSLRKPSRLSVFAALAFALTLPSRAILDTNTNAFSDIWEKQYNAAQLFTPTNPDHAPTADPDQDGWTNAQEALAGTNPFDGSIPTGKTTLRITPAAEAATYELTWPVIAGKSYRVQLSTDLHTWVNIGPIITAEANDTQHTLGVDAADPSTPSTSPPPRLFWRIIITDSDTDGDGLTTAEELALGLDPNNPNTLAPLANLDLATQYLLELLEQGLNAVAVIATPSADSDKDGLKNREDSVPLDPEINWERTPNAKYVWIEQIDEIDPLHQPIAINKDAQILFQRSNPDEEVNPIKDILWSSRLKNWVDLPAKSSQEIEVPWNTNLDLVDVSNSTVLKLYDINDDGTIYGQSLGIEDGNLGIRPGLVWKRDLANLENPDTYLNPTNFFPQFPIPAPANGFNYGIEVATGSIANDGTINTFALQQQRVNRSWMTHDSYASPKSNSMSTQKDLGNSTGFAGAILDKNRALFVETIHGETTSKIWLKEASGTTDISFMNTGQVTNLAEMSELPPCIEGKTPRLWITTGRTCYIERRYPIANGSIRWRKPDSMLGENVIRVSNQGVAITAGNPGVPNATPPKLWRNGKYYDLNTLTLKSAGSDLKIIRAIDIASNGLILVQATDTDGGIKKTGYLQPVAIEPDANMKGVIGDVLKSDLPGSSIKHFVTPKRSSELNQEFVELKAVGIDALTFSQFFEWEGGLPGDSAEKRRVRRDVTDRFPIKIRRKQGGEIAAEMHVWVIWCTVTARPGTPIFFTGSDATGVGLSRYLINPFD